MVKELLHAMKEYIIEYITHRLFIVSVVIFILFSILVGRLFRLQIVEGEEHLNNFTYKSKKTLTVEASRGNIFDCNGNLLAYNQLAYSVTFENSTQLTDVALQNGVSENSLKNAIVYRTIQILEKNNDHISVDFPIVLDKNGVPKFNTSSDAERLRFLAEVHGKSTADDLTDEQKEMSAKDIYDYLSLELFEISSDYTTVEALKIMEVRYTLWLNRFQQYMSVTIARDISAESVAELNENAAELMGIDVVVDSIRVYNDAKYFAHIIGYIGAISTDEMKTYNEELSEKSQYDSDDMIGKTGLEQRYESTLRGTNGVEEIYVDNMGKIIERTNKEDSVAGEDIYLTIDSDLQKYTYDTLEKEIASVVLAKITDEEIDEEDNVNKLIPIENVYFALFDNNTLDITHLSSEGAGAYEQTVNATLASTREYVLSRIRGIMTTENAAINNLDTEYTAYMEYIYSMLEADEIYNSKRIESTDETYKEYVAGNISLGTFLQYAINQGAIDITPFELSSDFYDSQEVYDALVNYVESILSADTEFDKLIMKYMIKSKNISGTQIIHTLFEQDVLKQETDEDYAEFLSGELSDYQFIRKKINNLEITPAQLALDPCEGSVVVTDVNTGEILAMVSYPSYNNNLLTNSVDAEYYATLIADKTKPLYNRATQQRTAPGSTYKMLTTIAAVETGAIDLSTTINAEGIFTKVDPPPKCWLYPGKHGIIGIEEALEVSCNYFFYEVGYRLGGGENHFSDSDGLSKLTKYASMFGLDTNSGIELDEIAPKVSDETVVRSAIGQGTNSYTPTQLARYVTTIATSGTCYDLSIIKEMKNIQGEVTYENPHKVHGTVDIDPALWNTVHNGMRRVVENHTPEEMLINQIKVDVAGKTGTAEENLARPAHALFVSYAPFARPEISVTAVIPYGYSSGNAEELAGFIYAYYFDPEKLENASITGNVNMSD
ncbi:MAG: penicillin-binding transpeptidase domain-containing protein [Clostridium sp.]|nr:penicillin-binding transpeptidase domain-containing protein [Clostridium sp.]